MVGLDGVEPSTSRLSGVRSNQTELQAPYYFGLRPAMNPLGSKLRAELLSRIGCGFWIHMIRYIQNPN